MKLKSTVLLLFVVSFTYQSLADASDVEVDEKENNQFPKEKPTYKPPKAQEKTFFTEVFQSEASFKRRWIYSKAKKDGAEEAIAKYDGKWSIEEPHNNPLRGDLALVLKSKAKHHAVSAKLDRPFEFTGKPFIIQYEVKFQNGIECGGAYIKLLSYHDLNQAEFHDKTPYTIMFGPDKCGLDHKLHFIFRHKNPVNGKIEEKHAKKPTANIDSYFADKRTHLYTLIVNPDSTFKILIDKGIVNEGSLLEDMSPPVNPPKEIEDLNDKKPEDWDEREKIPDPEATKPDDWNEDEPEKVTDPNAVKPEGWLDDEPELVPDPDADKPSDWDNDMDGEWEAPLISNLKCKEVAGCGKWKPPLIDNPQYKGKWRPPLIDNPNYKGVWKPRTIENPGYFEDNEPYKMMPIGAIGLELWSMTDDIMFDNFIITDNMDVADAWAADGWDLKHIEERAALTTGKSIVQAVLDATNERPWLWAVFIVVILLPIVLTIAYCCMSGSKRGMLTTLKEATDTRPWLWAVYATVLLLPIILLSICLCPKSGPIKPDDLATRKKTDKPTPDDQGKSEEEKTEVEEQKPEETPASKDDLEKEVKDDEMVEAGEKEGGAGDTNDKKPSKADLEAEQDAEDAERDADAEDDEPVEREYPRNSPRQRRPRKD